MQQVRSPHRVIGLIAGAAMLLAISACATTLPSATATHASSESVSASPTPVERHAATWTTTGSMTTARTRHTATLLANGTVLVAGGWDGSGRVQSSAELYDPISGTWTATGTMTMVRLGQTATLLDNGKVLVVGGMGRGSFSKMVGAEHSAELYDPASGSWSATGGMDEGFYDHTATRLAGGKVLIAGGGSAALYDPVKGIWRNTGKMIKQRFHHTATLLTDGRVLVAGGGADDDLLVSAELYDPATETWSAAGDMTRGCSFHRAVLLRDGTVLVTGGLVNGHRGQGWEAPAFDELYDPAIGTWTATGNMDAIRGTGSSIALLPDGTVLAVGGILRGKRMAASAELYDAASGIWTATLQMHEARTYQTATLLLDGTVLLAGGYGIGARNDELASAELYGPGSGS
jgi:N-acetylneuraminic acid mutarotase